ncbi:Rossmann-like and DUF2520 domain-containing protein [Polluticoccus soli]|uniref:Rossmann-like and DUF2520 domain-containing protein n=1 Tax=Polluticoccus soli TaxID=3034150 RepID=UPI0023E2017F|nr:Rossmann-like and DUF2520 domain-containing protein [Flavipsychrobacter sp. JY13-12]
MNYNLIGSGNTAWFFANKLSAAGHKCLGVYSRNKQTATELANEIQATVYDSLNDINDSADVCIIAISDHAIADIASSLSFRETVLLHTAGSVDISALGNAAIHQGVIWPIYSILKHKLPEHRNIPTVFEASSDKAKEIISGICQTFTNILNEATAEQRRWLHLSAVLSNNFTNHLMTVAESVCKAQGIPFSMLVPILQQTFERVQSASPYDVQTGPARRHDDITIRKHMDMLQAHSDWQTIYQAVTSSIENMYK